MDLLAVFIVVALAMGFNYTNGFHDAANAIATSVSTRALTPRVALVMAAVHALFGGMVGASLAAGTTVLWQGVLDKIVIPMVISPVLGLLLGYLVMTVILWVFRHQHPGRATRGFRYAQTMSAAAMALGHGLQDAGKTMGIIVLALTVGGYNKGDEIPLWVKVSTALVISAGTYAGGWRIMRTLGRKIIHLDPPQGFAAETAGASILWVAGLGFGAPISTTHTITSTIMGVGATKRLSAVRWGVAKNIVTGWVLTFPGAGLVAALCYALTIPFQ